MGQRVNSHSVYINLMSNHKPGYTVTFKVAFSTFWFKFGATLRRQAERRDSGTRQKASNLAQPIS